MLVFLFLLILAFAGVLGFLMIRFDIGAGALVLSLLVIAVAILLPTKYAIDNIVGDAEEYRFYLNGESHYVYYEQESEKYFKVTTISNWNPVKWLGKEYLETEDVEKFMEAYEKYDVASKELKEVDLFDYTKGK